MQQEITKTGDRVKALRIKAELSVDELAEAAGVHRATLYRIESGAEPNMATARAIAHALGVSVADLLQDEAA